MVAVQRSKMAKSILRPGINLFFACAGSIWGSAHTPPLRVIWALPSNYFVSYFVSTFSKLEEILVDCFFVFLPFSNFVNSNIYLNFNIFLNLNIFQIRTLSKFEYFSNSNIFKFKHF
jgi:hypothetical protein